MLESVHWLTLAAAVCGGAILSFFYFGGLWWTIHRMQQTSHPVQFYFLSLIGRMTAVLLCLYCVLIYFDWIHLAASIAAFMVARMGLIYWTRLSQATEQPPENVV